MALKTVEFLVEESGLNFDDIAQATGLPIERVMSIAEGRWTPSESERERIAAAFKLGVEEISWGHSMNPRNIRYGRYGLKENF